VGQITRRDRRWDGAPGDSAISEDGLSHLKGLTGLSKVSFSDTLVADAGLEERRRVLPKTQIVHSP
jgi:hypothetical protein